MNPDPNLPPPLVNVPPPANPYLQPGKLNPAQAVVEEVEEKPLELGDRPPLRAWIEALLRQPKSLAGHPATGGRRALFSFAGIAVASLLVFGVVLGTFAYGNQLWAAPVKLAAGTFFAALICFPSLYIFATLAGTEIPLNRLATVFAGMLALAGLLMLGFAPAIWIFAQGTSSFGFMGFLGLGAWLVAILFGFRFLFAALRVHGARSDLPLVIWSCIFLLVGLQLTATLRPILGRSEKFFDAEKKFFLEHWTETAGKSLRNQKSR